MKKKQIKATNKGRLGIWVSLLMVVFLVGCSNQSTNGGDSTKEETIKITVPEENSTLDSALTVDKNTFNMLNQLFEGLYRYEGDQLVPGLAKEEAQISEDGLTYEFQIREDAKWSNGEALTAHDFVYAWQVLANPETAAPNAYLLTNIKNAKEIQSGEKKPEELGVTAPSDHKLKVELTIPQPSFLSMTTWKVFAPKNQAFLEETGDQYAKDSEHVLYSGPYVLKNWKQSASTWTLEKNKDYYDQEQVKLDKIEVSVVKEVSTGVNLFASSEVDVTNISGEVVQQYAKEGTDLTSSLEAVDYFVDFNKTGDLANVHLRKAISHAINRESLTKQVLNDNSEPLQGLIPKNLYQDPQTGEDFRKFSGKYQTFDVKEAVAEFEKAKKELGKEEFSIEVLSVDEESDKKVAEYIQSQLQENLHGLKLTIRSAPRNNVHQMRTDKNYEMSISRWIAANADLNTFFTLYDSESKLNFGGYKNEQYDQYVRAAITTNANNSQAMMSDYKNAEKILLEDDAAMVPLYQSSINYLINPNLKDVTFNPFGDIGFRSAYLK